MILNQRLLAVAAGVAVLATYLATATGAVHGTNPLLLTLVFAIGPVAIVGILRFVKDVAPAGETTTWRLARLLLVVAFVLFTTMVILQQMFALQFPALIAAAATPATAETLRVVRSGVNLVQLGLDVAFDVFYCTGLIALGSALYRHPAFGKVIGAAGVICGLALLATNMLAFPYVPTERGLVDLGPVTGVWWLVVIGLRARQWRRPPIVPVSA